MEIMTVVRMLTALTHLNSLDVFVMMALWETERSALVSYPCILCVCMHVRVYVRECVCESLIIIITKVDF